MKKVYVRWNPLHERVVCVHADEDDSCQACDEEREKIKHTAYSLEGDWYDVKEKSIDASTELEKMLLNELEIVRKNDMENRNVKAGLLFYYVKTEVPKEFISPTLEQYEDMKAFGGDKYMNFTFDEFKELRRHSYEKAISRGYGIQLKTKPIEYADDIHLDEIKERLRIEIDNFIGFGDEIDVDNLK